MTTFKVKTSPKYDIEDTWLMSKTTFGRIFGKILKSHFLGLFGHNIWAYNKMPRHFKVGAGTDLLVYNADFFVPPLYDVA